MGKMQYLIVTYLILIITLFIQKKKTKKSLERVFLSKNCWQISRYEETSNNLTY